MMASSLIAGNDIRKMTGATRLILTDKNAIAINQDSLGVQGFRYAAKDSLETWLKPLSNGDWAVCFANRSSQPQKIIFNWRNENINDQLSARQLNTTNDTCKILNVWANKSVSNTAKPSLTTVAGHDVVMLRLIKQ